MLRQRYITPGSVRRARCSVGSGCTRRGATPASAPARAAAAGSPTDGAARAAPAAAAVRAGVPAPAGPRDRYLDAAVDRLVVAAIDVASGPPSEVDRYAIRRHWTRFWGARSGRRCRGTAAPTSRRWSWHGSTAGGTARQRLARITPPGRTWVPLDEVWSVAAIVAVEATASRDSPTGGLDGRAPAGAPTPRGARRRLGRRAVHRAGRAATAALPLPVLLRPRIRPAALGGQRGDGCAWTTRSTTSTCRCR